MLENHTPKFVIIKKKNEEVIEDKNTVDNFICLINIFPKNTFNNIAPYIHKLPLAKNTNLS